MNENNATTMKIHQWTSCARKIRHDDFWSAYLHLRGLQRLNPWADIQIYPCDYCEGLHVGNQLTFNQAIRSLKRLDRMMEHPNFERKANPVDKKMLKEKAFKLRNFVKAERAQGRGDEDESD